MSKIFNGLMGVPQPALFDSDVSINTKDYAIGGKMITVKLDLDTQAQAFMSDEEWRKSIRLKLATQLALAMLDQDLMETTSYQDPSSYHKTIAARCYLAPKDQVKILRVHAHE